MIRCDLVLFIVLSISKIYIFASCKFTCYGITECNAQKSCYSWKEKISGAMIGERWDSSTYAMIKFV